MTPRAQLSRDRFYRYMSICLAVVTALLLIPPDWVQLRRHPEKPAEPQPRPVTIVRLPPETLPPPPPLPPRPKPKPKPQPRQEEPPPKVQEIVELEPQLEVPEIEIPKPREVEKRLELQAQQTREVFNRQLETPAIETPREKVDAPRPTKVVVDTRPVELKPLDQQVEVTVPQAVPRQARAAEIQVAAATRESFHDTLAPDVEVVTPRPSARASDRPSLQPVSQQLRTGLAVTQAADAPAVDVPRGNTARPSRSAPVAISGAVTGTRVVYDANPGHAPEVAVASPKKASRRGAAPQLAATSGGTPGLKYSAAPADVAVGANTGPRERSAAAGKLEAVRSALARKYGLPLVSVNSLGQRSTEAARWNMLLPQISDLLRQGRGKGDWQGGPGGKVVSVTRDGNAFIIRYRDGIVHVLVPTEDGLANIFVARTKGSREVVSKVQEAEQALPALTQYLRGAS
ncbi:MAG: hypothetical protein Q9Q40_08820 [Acidobacteriota bacterium]|nr:hypothetical protein [Acidobacteriota bacterium]MDQ7088997.1 hypothetical protein [Acidobacteriota bacterium]